MSIVSHSRLFPVQAGHQVGPAKELDAYCSFDQISIFQSIEYVLLLCFTVLIHFEGDRFLKVQSLHPWRWITYVYSTLPHPNHKIRVGCG
jgi:hypothetical protein